MNYIRLIIATAFFIPLLFTGTAEQTNAQPVEFGFKGGANISTHTGKFRFADGDIDLTLTPKAAYGFQAGIIARKGISDNLRIQAEPSLIMMGANYNETINVRGFDFENDSRTQLLYVQLPVMLQVSNVPEEETVYGRQFPTTTYHFSGGLFGGYLPYANFSGTNTGAPIGIEFEGDFSNTITDQYKKFDGGLAVGAGFEYGSTSKVGLEARAQLSLLQSGDDPQLDTASYNFDPRNIAFTLSAYFMF